MRKSSSARSPLAKSHAREVQRLMGIQLSAFCDHLLALPPCPCGGLLVAARLRVSPVGPASVRTGCCREVAMQSLWLALTLDHLLCPKHTPGNRSSSGPSRRPRPEDSGPSSPIQPGAPAGESSPSCPLSVAPWRELQSHSCRVKLLPAGERARDCGRKRLGAPGSRAATQCPALQLGTPQPAHHRQASVSSFAQLALWPCAPWPRAGSGSASIQVLIPELTLSLCSLPVRSRQAQLSVAAFPATRVCSCSSGPGLRVSEVGGQGARGGGCEGLLSCLEGRAVPLSAPQ